jgi:hypothetical protein
MESRARLLLTDGTASRRKSSAWLAVENVVRPVDVMRAIDAVTSANLHDLARAAGSERNYSGYVAAVAGRRQREEGSGDWETLDDRAMAAVRVDIEHRAASAATAEIDATG